ncbi:hypothetical protein GA0061087_11058 [Priestia flexa]|nr:hypothetical protein GA0061087_11058 [Priestia flexa]
MTKENEVILAIETSCDETAVAIIRGGTEIVAKLKAINALGELYLRLLHGIMLSKSQ